MGKKIWILAGLCLALCMPVLRPEGLSVVRAKEQEAEQRDRRAGVGELSARGNMIYRDGEKGAGIYAADFFLLREKLAMVTDEVFDPVRYTHTHQWEYRDVNDRTHTRHCAICGAEFDLVDAHKMESGEECTISHGGKEFPGRRYRCVCGYQQERETAHVLTFDMVDETKHRSRCLLEGTAYCPGYESVEEEHYAFSHTPDQTGTYYTKTCIDCGYQTEERYEPEEIPEEPVEEPVTPEVEETPETAGEEPITPETEEAQKEPETVGEETTTPEPEKPSGETVTQEPDKGPETSVSGNDCGGDKTQSGAEETGKESREERGESL